MRNADARILNITTSTRSRKDTDPIFPFINIHTDQPIPRGDCLNEIPATRGGMLKLSLQRCRTIGELIGLDLAGVEGLGNVRSALMIHMGLG